MLEIFIVLNEKDKEKYQGEGSANNREVKRGGKRKNKHFVFFLFWCFFLKKRINAWVASQEALV